MWRWVVLVAAVLALAGCKSEPAFLGTWKASGISGETITFNKGGSVVIGNTGDTRSGTWTITGEKMDTISIQSINRNGQTAFLDAKWKVSDDGKQLTLTWLGGSGLPSDSASYLRQ